MGGASAFERGISVRTSHQLSPAFCLWSEDDVDIDGEADESELDGTGLTGGGSGGTSGPRRTGRQATDTRHITMAMLEEGGYFDMPLKARGDAA